MHIKKHLSFGSLRKILSNHFMNLPDGRQRDIKYTMHDCMMSGFAMMFYQDSSLLQFQRRLQQRIHKNNLKPLFTVKSIPKDSQMRSVIDEVQSQELEPIFEDFFKPLQRGKYLESYRVFDKYYIISMDGSGYFSSDKICCPGCLQKKKKGKVSYEHQIVQGALMHPSKRQVIPLAPEEVSNTDGTQKQDCESNAGKRLLKKIRRAHPKLPIIIVGDSLYSKQPFIEELKAKGMRYVLVAKEQDHKILIEWVNEQRQLGEVSRLEAKDERGRVHRYEWINEMPLNGNKETNFVNYFEYWIINDEGKVTYHNSWVTDFKVEQDNVSQLVRIGRCRWKIENEVFNTLKNQGYHIEHNYGHGKKHLSLNFFLLNLLAFFMHQIFELADKLYQQCRKALGSKKELWNNLRSVIRMLIFPDWQTLLRRVLNPDDFL